MQDIYMASDAQLLAQRLAVLERKSQERTLSALESVELERLRQIESEARSGYRPIALGEVIA